MRRCDAFAIAQEYAQSLRDSLKGETMSHFKCAKCDVTQVDSAEGYIAGCCHYPPENQRTVVLRFGGNGRFDRTGFYYKKHGCFYYNDAGMRERKAVHPVEWCDIPF